MSLRTWKDFLEAKGCDAHTKKAAKSLEDMEEKLGKDLDDDDEENEPKSHTSKVFGKKDEDEDDAMKSIFAKSKKSKK